MIEQEKGSDSEKEENSLTTNNPASEKAQIEPSEDAITPSEEEKKDASDVENTEEVNAIVEKSSGSSMEHDHDHDHIDDDDSDEDDDDSDDLHESEKSIDSAALEDLDPAGLLKEAEKAATMITRDALKRVREIRPLLNDALLHEKKDLLKNWVEADKDPDEFVYDDQGIRKKFAEIFHAIKIARKEEKERIEKEQIENLKIKEALLSELQELTEKDETDSSLNEVKEIQRKWRQIRIVPRDAIDELWKRYHYYLDKFYDNHSINIELKDLDRKKNLETKIELCKKVDEVSNEKSLKKSFILLNKYTEEFKNTGPVPKEYNEEIWARFRAACDKVYEEKSAVFKGLEEERKKNLELKQVLVEKAALIAAESYDKIKVWNKKTEELDALFAEWKKTGPVPKKNNQEIWKSFRSHFNEFYKHKSEYFKKLHAERKINLELKEAICVKAESLMDSNDFGSATKEILHLQEEWKKVGPVHEKVSNAIWKRFRKACDHFFNRKQNHFKHIKDEEKENLVKKNEIIERVNKLVEGNAEKEAVMKMLQEIQNDWNKIGYVPRKDKNDLDKRYIAATNNIIKKAGLDKGEVQVGRSAHHYEGMKNLPRGNDRLQDEIQKIKRKINFLNGEVKTWENNIGFFAFSKTANKLKEEIEGKIEKANDQISKLKAEIKEIRKIIEKDES